MFRRSALLLLVVLVTLAAAGATEAGRIKVVPFSLTVVPARLVVPANDAGGAKVFDVRNSGTRRIHVDVSLSEFSQAANGQIRFSPATPLSAAAWIDARPGSFDLAPGARKRVRVRISVPAHPEPGERQVGVLFRVPAPQGSGTISISGAIGAELIVNVPGPVVRRIALADLHVARFADGGPIRLRLAVENLGNVHRDYIHPSSLVAAAGGDRIPFPSFTVLRGSTRVVETDWPDPPLFCFCTVHVKTADGLGNVVVASARVIVFPFRLALGLLLGAGGVFLLGRAWSQRRQLGAAARVAHARQEAYEQARRELRERV